MLFIIAIRYNQSHTYNCFGVWLNLWNPMRPTSQLMVQKRRLNHKSNQTLNML